MSFYDIKIETLEELPSLEGSTVISDCDGTLFEHGTSNAYPDVLPALESVGSLVLVSACPDAKLMEERHATLTADISIHTQKARWYKGDMFKKVADNIARSVDKVVIIGDRPVADVGVAKYVFGRKGYQTLGVRVDRLDQPLPHKVDYVLHPSFVIGSALIKVLKRDELFRPRFEDVQIIAENFLKH